MSNTIPNIEIAKNVITDIYADPGVVAAGIVVGDKINIALIGQGVGKLYSGPTPPANINDETGYRDITSDQEMTNETGDLGAYIQSALGCTLNVKKG